MENIIRVGMADLKACCHPCMITTLGLGSCVGVTLFDPQKKVIGMAHIMLPDSTQIKNHSNIAKFADTAIDKLIEDMISLGASSHHLVAKLAGGAQMFSFSQKSDVMKIGLRNAIAAKARLKELKIPIIAEDTGGNFGRTIELYSDDGRLLIKTVGLGVRYI